MAELFPESPPQVIDGVTLKFPAKLWRIVNCCKTGAIVWEPDGDSIKVDRKKFEEQYLKAGVFFKTANFQSFIRQLNIYGFRKIPTNGPKNQDGAVFIYKHDFFKRGHPDYLSEVVRNTAVRKTQRENAIKEVEAKHVRFSFLLCMSVTYSHQSFGQSGRDSGYGFQFKSKQIFIDLLRRKSYLVLSHLL